MLFAYEKVSFALHPNGLEIVTASRRSFLLRHWDIKSGECKRVIKAHDHFVLCMDYEGSVCQKSTAGKGGTGEGREEKLVFWVSFRSVCAAVGVLFSSIFFLLDLIHSKIYLQICIHVGINIVLRPKPHSMACPNRSF